MELKVIYENIGIEKNLKNNLKIENWTVLCIWGFWNSVSEHE